MVKILKDIVLPIAVGILVAFVGSLFIPGNFLIHPVFEIKSPEAQTASSSQYVVTVTNTGLIQGKNVRIGVSYSGNLELIKNECPEGLNDVNKTSTQLLLQLDRMSTQLPCSFTVDLSKQTQLKSIVVTADNSPAYQIKSDENKSSPIVDNISWFITYLEPLIIVATVISVVLSLVKTIFRS